MAIKSKNDTKKKPTTNHLFAKPADAIDPRKVLLAKVAGSIAGSIMANPSPSLSTTGSIATVAVDLAEAILMQVGISSPEASAPEPASA